MHNKRIAYCITFFIKFSLSSSHAKNTAIANVPTGITHVLTEGQDGVVEKYLRCRYKAT